MNAVVIKNGDEILVDVTTVHGFHRLFMLTYGIPIVRNSAIFTCNIFEAAQAGLVPTINVLTGEPLLLDAA